MGNGLQESFYMLKSCITDRQVYDIVNDFALTQSEWWVILFGCLVLLGVSIAQEIREQMGKTEDIRSWLFRQNLWLRWTVLILSLIHI